MLTGIDGLGDMKLIYGTIVVEEKAKLERVDKVFIIYLLNLLINYFKLAIYIFVFLTFLLPFLCTHVEHNLILVGVLHYSSIAVYLGKFLYMLKERNL